MPPYPDMNSSMQVEDGVPIDDTVELERGAPSRSAREQAKTPTKGAPGAPWYRRRKVLYTTAIVVALVSVGLAVFVILWATDVIELGSNNSATVVSGTEGSNNQDNGGTDGDETTETEPPADIFNPSPAPQDVPPGSETTTDAPTATPTALFRTEPLQFYVMGDVPYAAWEEIMLSSQMSDMRDNLAPGAAFTVHVGDMQKGFRTNCALSHFYKVANILLQGPLPTFVQVGDNDYLDCPDPPTAISNYRNTFVGMEGNWTHSLGVERWTTPELVPVEYDVTRMVANPEMFAFVEDGILFIAFNILNMNLDQGELPDDLFYERLADSTYWVTKQLQKHKSEIRGVVMISHAMVSPDIRPFFENLQTVFVAEAVYSPVLYIHGDGHDFKINTDFGQNLGWPQLTRIEVDQGAYADPLLISVARDIGGLVEPLVPDGSGNQFLVGNGLFLVDRQAGRYPDSVNPDNRQ